MTWLNYSHAQIYFIRFYSLSPYFLSDMFSIFIVYALIAGFQYANTVFALFRAVHAYFFKTALKILSKIASQLVHSENEMYYTFPE